MSKSFLYRRIVVATLVLLAPCLGQQATTQLGNMPTELIRNVLSRAHLSGSLIYSATCEPNDFQNARVPYVRASPELGSQVATLQAMFVDDPKMQVLEDAGGIIRIVEAGVPSDVLEVKIHRISFEAASISTARGRLEF